MLQEKISIINYSYFKTLPTPACGTENNCTPTSESVITFYINGIDSDKPANVSYICTSAGVYNTDHNGMQDQHCAPEDKLIWNDAKYEIST